MLIRDRFFNKLKPANVNQIPMSAIDMAELADTPLLPGQVVMERSHPSIPRLLSWIDPIVDFPRQRATHTVYRPTRSGKLLAVVTKRSPTSCSTPTSAASLRYVSRLHG